MHAALVRHAGKAVADLHALDGVQPHHRLGDVGVQPVVDGLAQPHGHVLGRHAQPRAARIARLAQRVHVVLDRADVSHRGKKRVVDHMVPAIKADGQLAHLCHAATKGGAVALVQPLARHRAGGDGGRGQARGRAAAAARVAHAELAPVGVVGVAWAEGLGDVAIVLAALVGVADQQANRRAGGLALVHARQDLDLVRLVALGDEFAGAGAAAVQLGLDVRLRQSHAGRAPVDHTSDRRPMRFAKIGDGKQGAEGITAHAPNYRRGRRWAGAAWGLPRFRREAPARSAAQGRFGSVFLLSSSGQSRM